ncbi:hypothetical protein J4214_04600 [Candidatus Woesearchaeota archaeon]|nr:hypothetical protein [Candidatus Woesearchaeota archaeon]
MGKKGMVSQVFTYMLIIIVIGFVFVFGFNMIKKTAETAEKAKYASFRLDLENFVENIFSKSPGSLVEYSSKSRNKKPLILPKNVKKVCIKNTKIALDYNELNKLNKDDRFNVENINRNIILLPGKWNAFDIVGLKPEINPLCFDVIDEKMSFALESMFEDDENFVEIKKVNKDA